MAKTKFLSTVFFFPKAVVQVQEYLHSLVHSLGRVAFKGSKNPMIGAILGE